MLTSLPEEFRNLGNIRDDLFCARVTTKVWRDILLSELDRPILGGEIRQLVGRKIGPGVYEVRLKAREKGEKQT